MARIGRSFPIQPHIPEFLAPSGTGTLDSTLGALTSTGVGELDIGATASNTLGALTATTAAELDICATASNTLGALTATTAAELDIGATANNTLGALTSSGVAELDIGATASNTLGALTVTAAGSGSRNYDVVSSVVAAFGFRVLKNNYLDPLIRLRRDSDDAESDFSPDANGDLDVSAISTWLGGATGYVHTLYDQSGNNYDAVQATIANQPLFVASGQDGKPIVRFNGTDQYLVTTYSTDLTAYALVIGFESTGDVNNSNLDVIISKSTNLLITWSHTTAAFDASITHSDAVYLAAKHGARKGSTPYLVSGGYDGVDMTAYRFRALNETTAHGTPIAGTALALGASNTGGAPWPGDIYEFVLADAAWSTTERQDAELVLQTYWNISNPGAANVTLGALTATTAAELDISGTSSVTLGALTATTAAELDISATADNTLGVLTATTAAELDIGGTTDATLGALTLVGAGTLTGGAITGTLDSTLGALVATTAAELDIGGTADTTLADITLTSAGEVDIAATLDSTLGSLTLAGQGTSANIGQADITLGDVTLASAGEVDIGGTLDVTLGALTTTAAGIVGTGAYDNVSTNIAAAYGLRRLLKTYSGNLIRLRRDNDDAESDFTYNSNDELDTSAIASWLGANTAYVVTFYDQSGNGDDLTQATNANQPQYVASGHNSHPEIYYDGTDLSMRTTYGTALSQPFTMMVLVNLDPAVVPDSEPRQILDSDNDARVLFAHDDSPNLMQMYAGTFLNSSTVIGSALTIWTLQYNTTSSEMFRNGSSVASGDVGTANPTALIVGSHNIITINNWYGHFAEIIVVDPAWSTGDQQTAENIAATYWITTNGTADVTLDSLTSTTASELDIGGTLDSTLGALTLSSSSELDIGATLDVTLGAVTLTSASGPEIDGTLDQTLGTLVLAGQGTSANLGALDVTLDDVTATGVAELDIGATADVTLGALTLTSAAELDIGSTLAQTLDDVTLVSASEVLIGATLSTTLADVTLVGSGTSATIGTLDVTLADITLAGDSQVDIAGTADATLGALTVVSASQVDISATLDVTLESLSSNGVGELNIVATLDISLDVLTLTASGTSANTGQADVTLEALSAAAVGQIDIAATLAKTLALLTSSGIGQVDIAAVLDTTLGALGVSGLSNVDIDATLAKTLDALVLAGGGVTSDNRTATLDSTLDALTLAGQGIGSVYGTADITLGPLTSTTAATLSISGVTATTLADSTLVAFNFIMIVAVMLDTVVGPSDESEVVGPSDTDTIVGI